MLMISGEFDLSVGSVFTFVGMIFVLLIRAGFGDLPAFAGIIATCSLSSVAPSTAENLEFEAIAQL